MTKWTIELTAGQLEHADRRTTRRCATAETFPATFAVKVHPEKKTKNQMPILLAHGVNLVRARGNTIGVLQQRRTIVF